MKNKVSVIGASAIGGYGLLKVFQSKIDPYTRFSVGLLSGTAMAFSQNPMLRFTGIGVGIASFIQLIDVTKGGKLSFNKSINPVFVLHESKGVIELKPFEVPKFNIDGLTVKGLNGVFKLADGVYGGVNQDNSISTTIGIGSFVNESRNAGLKDKSWCESIANQGDNRWLNLYERSV